MYYTDANITKKINYEWYLNTGDLTLGRMLEQNKSCTEGRKQIQADKKGRGDN